MLDPIIKKTRELLMTLIFYNNQLLSADKTNNKYFIINLIKKQCKILHFFNLIQYLRALNLQVT